MNNSIEHLTPERCALLVVDIQERLMPVISGREEVLKNSVLLIKAAGILDIPIISTTQYAARIGSLLPEVTAELAESTPLDKMEFDCFANEGIRAAINSLSWEITTILVCGVETHICIYQTMVGGIREGYEMWVAADAVSSRAPVNHATGLDRIQNIGGAVANTELIIYDLLHRAGTPEFKALLPFLK
ncbi:MAG: isochorismatase family protein [Desulfobulbaceae bacterium]|nr:isochorismatase family protein [Desulfobulbaceae bacterium]